MRLAKDCFKRSQVTATTTMLLMMSSVTFAAEIDATAILKCQAMQDDASRLVCYDSLNSPTTPATEQSATDPAPAEPPAVILPPAATAPAKEVDSPAEVSPIAGEAAVAEPAALSDEIGKESLRSDAKKEKPIVRGHVISCREDATGRYLFYFDNGQIWQQKDNTVIRWKECAFEVTIFKDFFGYKMIPDGEKKRVRISRVK